MCHNFFFLKKIFKIDKKNYKIKIIKLQKNKIKTEKKKIEKRRRRGAILMAGLEVARAKEKKINKKIRMFGP
jgi:multidrug resistance efflux pump